MTSIKLLPMRYAGGIGNNCNALKGVGQLTCMGFIFPKLSDYECKLPSKETELRLNEFFNQATDPKSFAKAIRRVNYLLAMSLMRECETLQIDMKSVEDGYFWLNELAEILNPYLEVDE